MRSHLDIEYIERGTSSLAFDLFLPADTPPNGLVIFAHGGGFTRGDRKKAPVDRFAQRLTAVGLAMASASYRLNTPDTDLPVPVRRRVYDNRRQAKEVGVALRNNLMGPKLEAARQDIGALIAFFRNGNGPVDFSNKGIGLLGISAGGMAGLSLAYPLPNMPELAMPDCVIALGAALVHPWSLQKDGPPCLLLHSVEDRIIPPQNCALLGRYVDETKAPVQIELCDRKGHNAPVWAIQKDSAPDGTLYWDMAMSLWQKTSVLSPLPADV